MIIALTIRFKDFSQLKYFAKRQSWVKVKQEYFVSDQLCPRIKCITIKQAAKSCVIFPGLFKFSSYFVRS